jgi:uncharacterized cupredoxin-like copper-binding protein
MHSYNHEINKIKHEIDNTTNKSEFKDKVNSSHLHAATKSQIIWHYNNYSRQQHKSSLVYYKDALDYGKNQIKENNFTHKGGKRRRSTRRKGRTHIMSRRIIR